MNTPALIGLVVASFAATNIDTLVITSGLFAAAHRHDLEQVAVGQVAGFSMIVVVSLALAATFSHVPSRWFGVWGLIPLVLGLYGFWRLYHQDPLADAPEQPRLGVISVAAVILSSGGDNVAVYVPIFHAIGTAPTLVAGALFVVLDIVLCALAWRIGRHRLVLAKLRSARRWLVPLIYCAIGLVVIIRATVAG